MYLWDELITSATGVQQEDALGTLHFSLLLHSLNYKIGDNCNLLHARYLLPANNFHHMAKALDIIQEKNHRLSLELIILKIKIFWPSCDGSKPHWRLFLSDIER